MYFIREANHSDFKALPIVEQAAGMMYAQTRHARFAYGPNATESADPSRDRVWVAEHDEKVIGFALVRVFDSGVHLHELDVHPEHSRRGIGRQLIERVKRWAHEQRFTKLTLTTFSDVPWNAPYYSRLGFSIVEGAAVSSHLRKILGDETAAGFPMDYRVAMEMSL